MNYAPRPTVLRWLQVGKREGATHMLLVEDALADETVPVYVSPGEKLNLKVRRFNDTRSMRLVAVFDLVEDLEQQLDAVYR
ncbi:MAG TPA: hypothetical protein VJX67_05960 [Blastocatellia bacterium]|nr:hypothetical protein [Blastocatellia bacterium]